MFNNVIMDIMNVKQIFIIVFFIILLISGASSVWASDNSTDLNPQESDGDFNISDVDDYADAIINNSHQWSLDENGNLVVVPSKINVTSNDNGSQDNVIDLRKNNGQMSYSDLINLFKNNYSGNLSDIIDLIKNNSSIGDMPTFSSPDVEKVLNYLWDYHSNSFPSKDIVIDYEKAWNAYCNNPCGNGHTKELRDFLEFVKENSVKPVAIESSDISVFYSKDNVYKVRILNLANYSVGKDVNVTFIFNGKKINAKTDDEGYASFKFNSQPGNYVVKVFSGEKNSTNKIIVKSLFKTNNIKKTYNKPSKFTIQLIKRNGKSISKQTVKVTFKGKNYYLKTNSKGIATFNIAKNLKIGKHTIKITYNGCVAKNEIRVVK